MARTVMFVAVALLLACVAGASAQTTPPKAANFMAALRARNDTTVFLALIDSLKLTSGATMASELAKPKNFTMLVPSDKAWVKFVAQLGLSGNPAALFQDPSTVSKLFFNHLLVPGKVPTSLMTKGKTFKTGLVGKTIKVLNSTTVVTNGVKTPAVLLQAAGSVGAIIKPNIPVGSLGLMHIVNFPMLPDAPRVVQLQAPKLSG